MEFETFPGEQFTNYTPDYLISSHGRWYSVKKRQFLKQWPNNHGYMRVKVYTNGKPSNVFTHITVVAHFGDCTGNVVPIEEYSLRKLKLSIDHLDRNKSNNSIHNLEIVSHVENCKRKSIVPAYVPEYSLPY